jgi:LysR family transcriptional activator of nhaA
MHFDLNYNHLLYFKTIVEQNSIIKAAEYLRVGAPAISMQLKLLEDKLQKKLFIRDKKKLVLTDTGQLVYAYAKEIFNLGTELMTTLNDQVYGDIKIQIGVQDTIPKNLISSLTSYIYNHYPAMISVYNGSLEEMTLGVVSHRFDIALLNTLPIINDKSLLFSNRILKTNIVLAGAKKFLPLKNKPLSSFKNQPFILPTGQSVLRHKIEFLFKNENVDFHLVGESQDTIVQKNMAISGNGIIPIMKEAIGHYVHANQLFILKELPEIQDEIWGVTAKRRIENPIAADIIKKFKFV